MKILTPLQERALETLFGIEEVRRHFYLTGGTALSAFYLSHRYSDDLDLFTHSVDIGSIEREVEDGLRAGGFACARERASPTYRRYLLDGKLILDIVRDVEWRVGAPELRGNIMVDTKKNIAVNKVCAISGRLDPKDYVDLFFLLKDGEFDIANLLSLGKNKDGGLEPFQWSRVIADAETISILPRMIVPCDIGELKGFFKRLRDRVIDLARPPGHAGRRSGPATGPR